MEENEYGVKLLDGAWSLIGGSLNDAAAAAETIHKTINLGDRSTAIVEFVGTHPKGVRAADVAKALGIEADVAAVSLRRLANAEAIRKGGRGLFLPSKSVRSVLLTNQTEHIEQNKQGVLGTRDAHLADDGIVSRVRIAS